MRSAITMALTSMDSVIIQTLVLGLIGLVVARFIINCIRFKKDEHQWYDDLKDEEQNSSFRRRLKTGDVLEAEEATSGEFHLWAVCVQHNDEEQTRVGLPRQSVNALCRRLGRENLRALRENDPFDLLVSGSVTEYDAYRDALFDVLGGQPRTSAFCEVDLRDISRLCKIRINNARDKISKPKPDEEIVKCVREAVAGNASGSESVFGGYRGDRDHGMHFAERARYPEEALKKERLGPDRCSWWWWLGFGSDHCSPWFREPEVDLFRWLVRHGDMVEFDRRLYSHWAVCQYVDSDTFVHRSGCSVAEKGPIKFSPLVDIIKGCRFRINNALDTKDQQPCKVHEYLENFLIRDYRCSKAYGDYNLILNNCKRFAEYVRYGLHFRKNLELVSRLCSSSELLPLLFEGDVIKYTKSGNGCEYNWAIYVDKALNENGPPQVAYLCYHPSQPTDDPTLVRAEPLGDFFLRVGADSRYCINNEWDKVHPPLEFAAIAEFVRSQIGHVDTGECDLFSCTNLDFVRDARYGNVDQRTPSMTMRSWRILSGAYTAWHRLICTDCHHQ